MKIFKSKKRLHFSIIIFLVCLLFSIYVWDRLLHSNDPLDRNLVSNLILSMGGLFSVSAGLFAFSLERRRDYLEDEIVRRVKEIKELRGVIPICASCKKIRTDSGLWQQLETYIQKHSDARFSHGICQECRNTLYPALKNSGPHA